MTIAAATARLFRGSKRSDTITDNKRVRITSTPALLNRPHLSQHARLGDVGLVVGPSKQSPKMSTLYIIVRFDACGHEHRLLADELEDA